MRPLLCVLLIGFCAAPTAGAERVLQEWDFSRAGDTLGWNVADPLQQFGVSDGALVGVADANVQKLESPLFDIPASPWQYVELELKTDADGIVRMYYSNTTDEPYHGFRTGQYAQVKVEGDGEFHVYRIFPYWQKHGRIVHVRFDPPGKVAAVRAVRIIDAAPGEVTAATSWKFDNTAAGWAMAPGAGEVRPAAAYCEVQGDSDACFLSPPLDLEADDDLWVTLRISSKTPGTALFRWVSASMDGLQSAPIQLRGDGAVHSYAIELGDEADWTGRISAVGITPTDGSNDQTIALESITLGDSPVGPAELRITRFGTQDPFLRAGQKTRLIMEIKNIGGAAANSVAASVSVLFTGGWVPDDQAAAQSAGSAGKNDLSLFTKSIAQLPPGEVVRLEWDIELTNAGEYFASCRVTGLAADAGQASVALRVYPALDMSPQLKAAGYVPAPVPADTGEYVVACYYFPGWHTYDRWSVLNDYPERMPVLGYYREGDPEVADWQINWALSHGVSCFIYDWYWNEGARQLEHGLHDAFFNARYQDKMKFCLLWANHNPPAKDPEQDLVNVTKYWIENYFNRPNYLKIGGRNVMVIFSTYRITSDLGSTDKVKAAFDKMRKMCRDAGVGGLYIVGCTYPGDDRVKRLVEEGYDALSGYNYPSAGSKGQRRAPYEWMVEGYKDFWTQISDAASIPYIPVCEPGWDSRPWHGERGLVRTGKAPYLWERMLRNAKAFVDDPDHELPEGRKMIFLEAWNEFGEGDYIEPHAEFGFDYLEAVREVFAPESKEPVIVVPRDLAMGPYDLPKPEPRTVWDFSSADDQNWHVGNMLGLKYENGVMSAEAQNHDPAFYSPPIRLDASKFKTIEIKMKMDKGSEAQLFFSRPRGAMSEEKSLRFPVKADSQFHVYTLDMSVNRRWHGTIGQVRIDPNSVEGSKVEIDYVKFK